MKQNGLSFSTAQPTGFTLIELLVVITIIGIIYTMGHTVLTHSIGRSGLEAAAESIHATAKLARQIAVTRNQPVYLVFNEGQHDSDLTYRAYAVFTIDIHVGKSPAQASGYFIQDWQLLPDGVIFDHTSGGSTNLFSVSGQAAWNGAFSKNNQLLINNDCYVVLGCKPDGSFGSASHWIFLAEAFYSDRRLIHRNTQGKLVRFSTAGESRISDTQYTESGEITILGR